MTECGNCGAPTTNGLTLCKNCQQTLRVALTNTAAYFTDVERIRPGQRVRVRSAYQSTPPPATEPAPDKIAATLDNVSRTIHAWCVVIGTEPPATTPARCGWLEAHTHQIAALQDAPACLQAISNAERELQRILDRADTGWYAGVCGNEIGRETIDDVVLPVTCPRHLYGTQRSTWVRCPECGRTWEATDRRTVMLRESLDHNAPINIIASLLVTFTKETSVEKLTRRIEKWIQQGRVTRVGTKVIDNQPRAVYRVGDIHKLVTRDTWKLKETA